MRNDREPAPYLRALGEAVNALSEARHEADIIQVLLSHAVSPLRAQGGLVRLVSPDGEELLLTGALGLSEAYLHKGPVRVTESRVDQRVLAGEVVVIADVTRESGFQYPQEAAREGLRGMVAIPLSLRGRVIGLLRVYVERTDALRSEEVLLLRTLANLGAFALEKANLHQNLYRIAEALNASLELEPMLQRVLEATVEEMGLKAASVRLLDPERHVLRLAASYGLSEAYLAKGEIHVAKSPMDQRVLQGETVVLYDVEHEPGFEYPQEATREGIRSVLAVPLRLKGRTIGVMRVYAARPRYFGAVAVSFLTSVVGLVGLAVENAELYAALQARYQDLKLDLAEWYRFLALG